MTSEQKSPQKISTLANFIFMTRWLQLPLYIGLILAQIVYVYHFWVELVDLVGALMGNGNRQTGWGSGFGFTDVALFRVSVLEFRVHGHASSPVMPQLGALACILSSVSRVPVVLCAYPPKVSKVTISSSYLPLVLCASSSSVPILRA